MVQIELPNRLRWFPRHCFEQALIITGLQGWYFNNKTIPCQLLIWINKLGKEGQPLSECTTFENPGDSQLENCLENQHNQEVIILRWIGQPDSFVIPVFRHILVNISLWSFWFFYKTNHKTNIVQFWSNTMINKFDDLKYIIIIIYHYLFAQHEMAITTGIHWNESKWVTYFFQYENIK